MAEVNDDESRGCLKTAWQPMKIMLKCESATGTPAVEPQHSRSQSMGPLHKNCPEKNSRQQFSARETFDRPQRIAYKLEKQRENAAFRCAGPPAATVHLDNQSHV